MNQGVQATPALSKSLKQRIDCGIAADVAGQGKVGTEGCSEFFYSGLEFFILVSKSQFRTLSVHSLGDSPGYGPITRESGNEHLFAIKESHGSYSL